MTMFMPCSITVAAFLQSNNPSLLNTISGQIAHSGPIGMEKKIIILVATEIHGKIINLLPFGGQLGEIMLW